MSKNTCVPSSVYGPFTQTLFLGSSVTSFTSSVGWNTNASDLTVQLVDDECSGTKVYWDKNLNQRTHTGPDPGFTYPTLGVAVYFRIGSFEFSGILQSWVENRNSAGRPTYTIRISDPRDILQDAQIIINDYAGAINSNTYNLINVFGYTESFGVFCPATTVNGANFGTLSGGYGGANVTDRGIQWNSFLLALRILTASLIPTKNAWSPHGRLVFRGPQPSQEGYGVIVRDGFDVDIPASFSNHSGYVSTYLLDLSSVPFSSSFIRLSGNGTHISVMDAISEICNLAGCDYYIELIPVKFGGQILKFIKVRTVVRGTQPNLGEIEKFISSGDNNFPAKGTEKSDYGRELRQEPTTSFLIGDNQRTIYQAFQSTDPEGDGQPSPPELDDIILPYYGIDSNRDVIVPTQGANGWQISSDITALNDQLNTPLSSNSITITEKEIRYALSDFDGWKSYSFMGNVTNFATLFVTANSEQAGIHDATHLDMTKLVQTFAKDTLSMNAAGSIGAADTSSVVFKDLDSIFAHVKNIADTYYGKKFQIRLPFSCVRQDIDGGKFITSEEPVELGWTEHPTILGLSHPSVFTTFFGDSDGRIGPFAGISNASGLDVTELDEENYLLFNNNLYLRASVESDLVYLDYSSFAFPRVVIILSEPLYDIKNKGASKVGPEMRGFVDFTDGTDEDVIVVSKKLDGQAMNVGLIGQAQLPDAVAIPLKSNILTYGPWVSNGPPGGVKVRKDNDLVPWNYGSLAGLSQIANIMVNSSVTAMQVSEMGSVSVPGLPVLPLGAEIGAQNAIGGQGLVETRQLVSESFRNTTSSGGAVNIQYGYINTDGWSGLFGPNISSIYVEIGQGGIRTTYKFRTYTPVLGRFTKQTTDRIRVLQEEQTKTRREMEKQGLLHSVRQNKANELKARKDKRNKSFEFNGAGSSIGGGQGTLKIPDAPEIIIAQKAGKPDAPGKVRNKVSIHDGRSTIREMGGEYDKKAFMSWDGILRPVSMAGDGGLPQYPADNWSDCKNNTGPSHAQPPVIDQSTSNKVYDLNLGLNYQNPLTNPAGKNFADKHGTSVGHDIDIIGRGATPPVGHLSVPIDELAGEDAYNNDYRFMALRGPLIMQSWGYDTDGKPIPNQADVEVNTSGGTFVHTALEDTFMTDWLQKSHTWPVAPVDLRYDRRRRMWVSPPSYKLIVAKVIQDISAGGSGNAIQTDGSTLYGSGGISVIPADNNSTAPLLNVLDVLNKSYSSGDKIIGYYDTDQCRFFPIEDDKIGSGTTLIEGNLCLNPAFDYPIGSSVLASTIYTENGLRLNSGNSVGSNAVRLGLDILAYDTIGTLKASGVSKLYASTGVTFAQKDDCSLWISASGSTRLQQSDECLTPFNDFPFGNSITPDTIRIDGGLRLNDYNLGGTNDIRLALDVLAYDTNQTLVASGIHKLYALSGVTFAQKDDCSLWISASGTAGGSGTVMYNTSYCWNEGPEWWEPGVDTPPITRLGFGNGLQGFMDSASSAQDHFKLALDIGIFAAPIRNNNNASSFSFIKQGVSSFYFGSGITATPIAIGGGDDCGIIIDTLANTNGLAEEIAFTLGGGGFGSIVTVDAFYRGTSPSLAIVSDPQGLFSRAVPGTSKGKATYTGIGTSYVATECEQMVAMMVANAISTGGDFIPTTGLGSDPQSIMPIGNVTATNPLNFTLCDGNPAILAATPGSISSNSWVVISSNHFATTGVLTSFAVNNALGTIDWTTTDIQYTPAIGCTAGTNELQYIGVDCTGIS